MFLLPRENFRSPGMLARFALTALAGLMLDLWTKALAFQKLAVWGSDGTIKELKPHEFIRGWLHFALTTNPGAVFGIGEGRLVLFVSVSIAAIIFLIYLFAHSGPQKLYQLMLGMLLAGVLGNLYDRLRYAHVRDMIHALPGWRWGGAWTIPLVNYPAAERFVFPWIFNVADVLLCTGVGLMVAYSLVHPRGQHKEQ